MQDNCRLGLKQTESYKSQICVKQILRFHHRLTCRPLEGPKTLASVRADFQLPASSKQWPMQPGMTQARNPVFAASYKNTC